MDPSKACGLEQRPLLARSKVVLNKSPLTDDVNTNMTGRWAECKVQSLFWFTGAPKMILLFFTLFIRS